MNDVNEILQLVKSGDESAFAVLAHTYEPMIKAQVALFMERLAGAYESEDLVQESTVALFKAAMSYDTEKKGITFGLYAKICVKNRLISLQRKFIRASIKKTAAESKIVSSGARVSDDLSAITANAISTFSAFERGVFTLYLEGCSYKEIADRLNKDTKSIDNAMCRIRAKIRRYCEGIKET